jgi:glycosyltransferase involved in cell wall biosynthesis
MRLFVNGLGASAGAGITYLLNVLPHLSANISVHTIVAVQPQLRAEFDRIPNLTLIEAHPPQSAAARFWFEQRSLPQLIRNSGADVLISCGNFALRNSPVPQILLSGNSLYTSSAFERDLRRRCELGMWLDHRIKSAFAKQSIRWADWTVAPSQAFADELKRWIGREVSAIHHGFDRDLFFRGQVPLADDVQSKLLEAQDSLRLLFVSHYNYYRNFETLFQALPLITEKLKPRKVRLFLTCKLQDDANPGAYRTQKAAHLVRKLGIGDEVVELGTVPYRSLHHLYRACDIYVSPAYTETFAHPLVEAMASGLPIVASDLPVHREVTAGMARFFPRFSPQALAEQVAHIAASAELKASLSAAGRVRAEHFSWKRHVEELLKLAFSLQRSPASKAAASAA